MAIFDPNETFFAPTCSTEQVTGEPLTRRSDDTEEKLKKRLEAFHKQTKPVVEHYSKLGKMATIDAAQDMKACGSSKQVS